jgi:hypothetical protein
MIQEGYLTITSVKRTRLLSPETHSCERFKVAGQEFLGTLCFFPTSPMSSFMVIASVYQSEVRGGTFSDIPRLSVSRLLPTCSTVFQLARDGQVEELQSLILQKKASLSDRDINGHSLLHVSLHLFHESACRTLADILVIVRDRPAIHVPVSYRQWCRCE